MANPFQYGIQENSEGRRVYHFYYTNATGKVEEVSDLYAHSFLEASAIVKALGFAFAEGAILGLSRMHDSIGQILKERGVQL